MRGWLQRPGAARYADVSEKTIDRWRAEGLPAVKSGKLILIKREWIDEFLEARVSVPDVEKLVGEVMR
jgi:excisionase family DNA binding protein